MDEGARLEAVTGIAGDTHRDRRVHRLCRGLDLERARRDDATDAVGDLERLLDRRAGQEDTELLPAEAGSQIVLAQLAPEDVRDTRQDGVAGQMAVGVVDLAQQVEVGHDHRERLAAALSATELVPEDGGEVAGVVQACLDVDAGLCLERGNAQAAVDEHERRQHEEDQPAIVVPRVGHGEAERGKHDVRREVLDGEQPAGAEAVPAGEKEHRREQKMIDRDHGQDRCDTGEGASWAVSHGARAVHCTGRRPGAHQRERPVGDVERLDVPAVANVQPLGDVLHERDEGDEPGRQDQRRGDEEHDRGVVRLVARRSHDEELRQRGSRAEREERQPVAAGRQIDEKRAGRADGRDADGDEERLGTGWQRGRERARNVAMLDRALERDGVAAGLAHSPSPAGRRVMRALAERTQPRW